MMTLSKNNRSRYAVRVGYGLTMYATSKQAADSVSRRYGADKVDIKRLK